MRTIRFVLFQTIEFPLSKQREFSVTAIGMGLSLNQILASRRVEQSQRQGQDARGAAVTARHAWKKVEATFARFERFESGKMAHGALSVFRPEGHLNDRAWAEQQIAVALPLLSGREWSKVWNFLQAQETLTFLDRLHRPLREAVPEEPLRAELVRLWWLRRQRPRANTLGAVVGAGHAAHLVQEVVRHKMDANWRKSYEAVARVPITSYDRQIFRREAQGSRRSDWDVPPLVITEPASYLARLR